MFNILGLRFLISLLLVLGFKILNIVDPPILFEPMSRPGHSDPDRVSALSNRILIFRIYQNHFHSVYMKVWFKTGSGSIKFGFGDRKFSKNRYNMMYFQVWVSIHFLV